jgi:hypothetical protein
MNDHTAETKGIKAVCDHAWNHIREILKVHATFFDAVDDLREYVNSIEDTKLQKYVNWRVDLLYIHMVGKAILAIEDKDIREQMWRRYNNEELNTIEEVNAELARLMAGQR